MDKKTPKIIVKNNWKARYNKLSSPKVGDFIRINSNVDQDIIEALDINENNLYTTITGIEVLDNETHYTTEDWSSYVLREEFEVVKK